MGAELELKYAADPQLQQKILADHPGAEVIEMETTYFDTRDGKLSEKRYTLRLRLENGSPVCTVKTPLKGFGRGEWEVSHRSIEEAIPLLCAAGAPRELSEMTREGIAPICGAKFTRRAVPIARENFTAELAVDAGILTGGSRQTPLCEVELEYKSGDLDTFLTFAEDFRKTYCLSPEPLSKFRRALNLYLGES